MLNFLWRWLSDGEVVREPEDRTRRAAQGLPPADDRTERVSYFDHGLSRESQHMRQETQAPQNQPEPHQTPQLDPWRAPDPEPYFKWGNDNNNNK